ncbi:MAG: hypothetical protein C4527_04635 [Candidatus Omnitrophota bacterium]|jgi:hypothetical protein|nr:MAG: hypothetical protein C4527_04635 [Candidatus Omnitrophota bacterium]
MQALMDIVKRDFVNRKTINESEIPFNLAFRELNDNILSLSSMHKKGEINEAELALLLKISLSIFVQNEIDARMQVFEKRMNNFFGFIKSE